MKVKPVLVVPGSESVVVMPTYKAYSVSGPALYYFGIVDFLQDWTFHKKVERAVKIYALRKDPEGLSVMEPFSYKSRFQKKMEQIFDLEEFLDNINPKIDPAASVTRKSTSVGLLQPKHYVSSKNDASIALGGLESSQTLVVATKPPQSDKNYTENDSNIL